MKINFSKQTLYLFALSIFLFIVVLMFSFMVLIPNGKEYRIKRTEVRKQSFELRQLENFHANVEHDLQKLQSDNKHIIKAFKTKFDAVRFQKQYGGYFSSLNLSKKVQQENNQGFATYDINTTSLINSPQSFYTFLEAINKSDWIISIKFPIDFKRDAEVIKSSFRMRVYKNIEDLDSESSSE